MKEQQGVWEEEEESCVRGAAIDGLMDKPFSVQLPSGRKAITVSFWQAELKEGVPKDLEWVDDSTKEYVASVTFVDGMLEIDSSVRVLHK